MATGQQVNPRVTAAMRKNASAVLAKRGITNQDFVSQLCETIITADDSKTRWCVLTVDSGSGEATVFGPYATRTAAEKAIQTGMLASRENTRGAIMPLHQTPKNGEWTTNKETNTLW